MGWSIRSGRSRWRIRCGRCLLRTGQARKRKDKCSPNPDQPSHHRALRPLQFSVARNHTPPVRVCNIPSRVAPLGVARLPPEKRRARFPDPNFPVHNLRSGFPDSLRHSLLLGSFFFFRKRSTARFGLHLMLLLKPVRSRTTAFLNKLKKDCTPSKLLPALRSVSSRRAICSPF